LLTLKTVNYDYLRFLPILYDYNYLCFTFVILYDFYDIYFSLYLAIQLLVVSTKFMSRPLCEKKLDHIALLQNLFIGTKLFVKMKYYAATCRTDALIMRLPDPVT